MSRNRNVVQEHPAESTTAVAGAIVVLLGLVGVQVDPTVIVAAVGGVAALPAIVTAIVKRVRGV